MTLVLVVGMVGAGALAYFQDTETSTGNTFTAGTFDLEVGDWNEGFGDGVSATWTMSNMVPGVTTVGPLYVNLQNAGSLVGDHVEVSFSHVITDTPDVESDTNWNSTPGEMAEWLEIIAMSYNGTNWVTAFIPNDANRDPNNNSFFDLEDVTMPSYADEGGFLDNLPAPLATGYRSFTLELKFNAGATNDIQGDTLTTTVAFTLNQEASQ